MHSRFGNSKVMMLVVKTVDPDEETKILLYCCRHFCVSFPKLTSKWSITGKISHDLFFVLYQNHKIS